MVDCSILHCNSNDIFVAYFHLGCCKVGEVSICVPLRGINRQKSKCRVGKESNGKRIRRR